MTMITIAHSKGLIVKPVKVYSHFGLNETLIEPLPGFEQDIDLDNVVKNLESLLVSMRELQSFIDAGAVDESSSWMDTLIQIETDSNDFDYIPIQDAVNPHRSKSNILISKINEINDRIKFIEFIS